MTQSVTLSRTDDGVYQTDIYTDDGVSVMELHFTYNSDSKLLTALQSRKFYQQFKGEWVIIFKYDGYRLSRPSFDQVIEAAQSYIFNRDNDYTYTEYY